MKHYDSFENIKVDKSLIGEEIWAFNKLDGQNLCVKYNARKKEFQGFGSRKCVVGEDDAMFGNAVKYFKQHYEQNFLPLIKENSGKKGIFNGVEEITFYFEWYGDKSFAGFHQEGDELRLALIDVFLKKKGYIEPKPFYDTFCNLDWLETPELIYKGKLTNDFIRSIQENDWTVEGCQYPTVKEGVVCRRSTILKGQNMPKVKIKTVWWMTELHKKYTPEECKELE